MRTGQITEDRIFKHEVLDHMKQHLGYRIGSTGTIESESLVRKADFLEFMTNGCRRNIESFENLVKKTKSRERAEEMLFEAIKSVVLRKRNGAFVMRKPLVVNDCKFDLINHRLTPGKKIGNEEFRNNIFTITPETSFSRKSSTQAPLTRIVDASIHINGIYIGFIEFKSRETGQKAAEEGVKKVADDYARFATMLSKDAVHNDPTWKRVDNNSKEESAQLRILKGKNLPYEKACFCLVGDMIDLFVLNDFGNAARDIDRIVCDDSLGDYEKMVGVDAIKGRIEKSFRKMPDIPNKRGTAQFLQHLENIFCKEHLIWELFLFNRLIENTKTGTRRTKFIKARTAQKHLISECIRRMRELYTHEDDIEYESKQIIRMIKEDIPGISDEKIAEILERNNRLHNNNSVFSILLQGAAGVGKTNVLAWLSMILMDETEHGNTGELAKPKFDKIFLVSDRLELNRNISTEFLSLNKGKSNQTYRNISSQAQMIEALKDPSVRIISINIQKMPGLAGLIKDDPKMRDELGISDRRFAFIIDEVHRSQNGDMHGDMLEIFDALAALHPKTKKDKRNLVIGLTATPSDAILMRFGEYHSSKAAGDDILWVPFAAYTMKQAVEEGYVFDPSRNITKGKLPLHFEEANEGRLPTSDEIYENPERQALIAQRLVRIFAATTIRSIRPIGENFGRGKAIFAVNSIKAAQHYFHLIKRELLNTSALPEFKDCSEKLKEVPVVVIYTSKQGETSCSELNGCNEDQAIDRFRCTDSSPGAPKNSIIIVVDKLLTGFDEPTLHTIFIDKSLSGIALFQAVNRVNRWHEGKASDTLNPPTLVVDFSIDNNVGDKIPEVFKKFGGITLSDSNPFAEEESADELLDELRSHPFLSGLWKEWKASFGKDTEGLTPKMRDALDNSTKAHVNEAWTLLKTIGTYRNITNMLRGILFIDSEHKSASWHEFLIKCALHIRASLPEKMDTPYIPFEILDAGEIYDFNIADGTKNDMGRKETQDEKDESKDMLDEKDPSDMQIKSILDAIIAANAHEDEKIKELFESDRLIQILFEEIDRQSKSDGGDWFRKNFRDDLFTNWDDKTKSFSVFFKAALRGFKDAKLKAIFFAFKGKESILLKRYEAHVKKTLPKKVQTQ